jgi:hypothetical protein
LLYTALVASRVLMDGAEGCGEGVSRPALVAAVLTTNLVLMVLPPLLAVLLLAGVVR